MKGHLVKGAVWAGAVLMLVLAGATTLWWMRRDVPVRIAGEGAELARAEAVDEMLLPEALDAAAAMAEQRDVRALVVHRRGHRVFEHFTGSDAGEQMIGGGELAVALLELALHQPGEREGRDAAQVATLISERLWLPLRAHDAWLTPDAGPDAIQCCIGARLDDWMRFADLLNATGSYRGERIIGADPVRALLAVQASDWQGDEPLLARDATAFDLDDGVRIWLAPQRALTILVAADAAVARDTLLPNLILRGLNDASPAIGGDISGMVPGH